MQTNISETFLNTPQGQQAEDILRACVHCGFCTATCPTYQLLGDELDSPRGRIYLIKQVLEGHTPSQKTQQHLDRCLTCRSCETTCPSGVRYGQLVDIGREQVEQQVARPVVQRIIRLALRQLIPYPKRFGFFVKLGQKFKPLLPTPLKSKIPELKRAGPWPQSTQQRQMLALAGCAQQVVTPDTNATTARVLHKLGISLIEAPKAGCCGAVSQHLCAADEALAQARQNIDAWWPYIEQGVEAIVITASGCGVMLKDYAHLLADDPDYASKAHRVSELAKDISEILHNEPLSDKAGSQQQRIAFHSPCTLQHGQQLNGVVEQILGKLGYQLCEVENPHLCCGSAGTYSILQPELSGQLLSNKLTSLQRQQPEVIATANIGCQMHLGSKARVPVIHWIDLVEQALI